MVYLFYIFLFLLTLNISNQISDTDITCRTVANEKWIAGLQGLRQYEKYNEMCISNEDIVLRYYACLVDGVKLNTERLNKIYPNLKVIYWQCRGFCTVSTKISSLHVYGCQQS